jgi:hypothetical protein
LQVVILEALAVAQVLQKVLVLVVGAQEIHQQLHHLKEMMVAHILLAAAAVVEQVHLALMELLLAVVLVVQDYHQHFLEHQLPMQVVAVAQVIADSVMVELVVLVVVEMVDHIHH